MATVRLPYDHLPMFFPNYQGLRTVSVRCHYDVSTAYGLTIFKICQSADYYKHVEADGDLSKP